MKMTMAGSVTALSALFLFAAAEADDGAEPVPAPAEQAQMPAGRPPEPTLEGGTAARDPVGFESRYPEAALRRGEEGWVIVSFVVTRDGKVADPIIEDSSGVSDFEKDALRSLRRVRYEKPATLNGEPIEQCATKLKIMYAMRGPHNEWLGARAPFRKAYEKVGELIAAGRAQEAAAQVAELGKAGGWNLYEYSRLWLLQADLQRVAGDLVGAMRSVERATMTDDPHLEKAVYRDALLELFRLQAMTLHYQPALDTYEKMQKLKPRIDNPDVERAVREIRAIIASPGYLSFPGMIEYRSGVEEGRPNWQHPLVRRKFAFDDIQGQVDNFQLRCDWRLVSGKVTAAQAWEVPRSWGACQVFVFGEVGAKVKLIEYPLAPPPAASLSVERAAVAQAAVDRLP